MMSRSFALMVAVLAAIVVVASASSVNKVMPLTGVANRVSNVQLLRGQNLPQGHASGDNKFSMCPLCVSFMGQAFNQLLNIILNAGVIGGCEDLCGKLPEKLEQTACMVLCSYVGIKEFINIISHTDFDPIYLCELFHTCPIHDGGAGKITNITIDPPSGPQGTTFSITILFQITAETGTGEVDLEIDAPVGFPLGAGVLNEGLKPGSYGIRFDLQAEPSEDQPFEPGTYESTAGLCVGECGSKHPHSAVLDTAKANFQITESN